MTDILPPVADVTMMTGAPTALSMRMGPGADIGKTAQDFEAMFATQMLQPMFEGIEVDPTFGGGNGEQVMRSFLLQEYGKLIAKTDKLGIAAQVKNEMLRAQEGANGRGSGATARTGKTAYAATVSQGGGHVTVQ